MTFIFSYYWWQNNSLTMFTPNDKSTLRLIWLRCAGYARRATMFLKLRLFHNILTHSAPLLTLDEVPPGNYSLNLDVWNNVLRADLHFIRCDSISGTTENS